MKELTEKILIQKTLQQEKNRGGKGEMWITLSDQIILLPFELRKVDLETGLCWFILLREDDGHSELFSKSREIKCFFPNSGAYIFTSFHSFNSDSFLLKTKLPDRIYLKERRQDERYETQGELSLKFYTESRSRTFKIFDISKGGVSIILAKTDVFFSEEDGLFEVTLLPYGIDLSIELTAKLKIKPFVFESIPYAGQKLSFKFHFNSEKKLKRWEKMWSKLLEKKS